MSQHFGVRYHVGIGTLVCHSIFGMSLHLINLQRRHTYIHIFSREFSAYLGLTPRQYSSGGKTNIVGIYIQRDSYSPEFKAFIDSLVRNSEHQ